MGRDRRRVFHLDHRRYAQRNTTLNEGQALQFQLALGPAGEIFREAGDQATRRRREIEAALSSELGRYRQPNGEVVMQSSSWTVTARRPSI